VAEPGAQPSPEPGSVALDIARLDGLRRLIGDAEFQRLADKFLGDLSRRVAAMAQLGDRASLAREAHTLRGTAGSYGLETVAALAGRLEAACADAASADMTTILAALSAGMEASVARLTEQFGLERAP
jgi:HPt (histidine-containing phosphotransfer) domain-containing protein